MLESLGQINNIYALTATVIVFCLLAVSVFLLLFFFVKRIGKFHFKSGNTEFEVEGKHSSLDEINPSPSNDSTHAEPIKEVKPNIHRTLTDHQFFVDMLKWEKRDIQRLPIKSQKKKLVVVEFLQIKFRIFRNMLRSYIVEAEMLLNNGQEFKCDKILQLFWESIDQYNSEARKHEIRLNNHVMVGIPEMFLEKFDKWHTPHIEIINDTITKIVNNEIYPDDYVKVIAIIEVFYIAFKLTILDAVGSINELNGELEKLLEEKLGA